MFKQLKLYYFYVASPYVLLIVGGLFYSDAIKSTITRNPHPQINYAIFSIIIIGGLLILSNVYRLIGEARMLKEFSAAIHAKTDFPTLQKMVNDFNGNIASVLRMIATSGGRRTISQQEQRTIEGELARAATRLTRNNALPQFLTGLLVGMGLLGTFIGLLATLNDISALIVSFADIDMGSANPITVFRTMIERMKAPMQSMGIAFSASLFGLLGSIILGLMMVALRRFQNDIHGVLSSEVAQHIEAALSHQGFDYTKGSFRRAGELPGPAARSLDVPARAIQPPGDPQITVAAAGTVSADGSTTDIVKSSERAQVKVADTAPATIPGDSQDLGDAIFKTSREDLQILMRIEARLSESARWQKRSMDTEIDEFQKQRGEMLRTLTEHTEANNNFRSELQRVGRQLGTLLNILEKSNTEFSTQITELSVSSASAATETNRLLAIHLEEQRKLNELLNRKYGGS